MPVRKERAYCMTLCKDERWLVLNRNYKPFGEGITTWVDYDTCRGIRLLMTQSLAKRIDSRYTPTTTMIWFYDDETNPNIGRKRLAAYRARLASFGLTQLLDR